MGRRQNYQAMLLVFMKYTNAVDKPCLVVTCPLPDSDAEALPSIDAARYNGMTV